MTPRRVLALFGLMLLVFVSSAPSTAGDDKQLQSQKGDVAYQVPNGKPVSLGVNAVIGIADRDYAITGGESLAQVLLPDSSRVLVGSDTKVQLAFFNQAQIATAKFVVYQGRVRFAVRHPQGARANYTFSTPTASVGVRGTQGDIEYGSDGSIRVNVYELCDPQLPVQVTTRSGKIFTIRAGQSLFAHIVNGIVQAEIQQLTQQLIGQFAGDFGVPSSWDAAKGEVIGYAGSSVNNATGGYGTTIVNTIGGLFKKKATPSPAPTQSTCS